MLNAIEHKLKQSFSPLNLEVIDESHKHQGHAGAREGEVTHIRITITAAIFTNHSKIECHRMVYKALAEEMSAGLHAIAIYIRINL